MVVSQISTNQITLFHHQETFWRIPVNLNPDRLRRAAKDLDGSSASENGEGIVFLLTVALNVFLSQFMLP